MFFCFLIANKRTDKMPMVNKTVSRNLGNEKFVLQVTPRHTWTSTTPENLFWHHKSLFENWNRHQN